MRKDVILGMSIGGVLLAIVAVCLVLPNHNRSKAPGVDPGKDLASENGNSESPEIPQTPTDTGKPAAVADGGRGSTQSPTTPGKSTASASAAKPKADDPWSSRLNGRMMLSNAVVTHTPDAAAGPTAAAAVIHTGSPAAHPTSPAGSPAPPGSAAATTGADPAATGRTHVIQKGETLSSIAAVVYGNANYYPHILRANPNLNPNRMKVGTTIVIPDIAEPAPPRTGAAATPKAAPGPTPDNTAPADTAAAEHSVPVASQTLDTTREYSVQPGDSLHKIAIKLYGKISMVDKIYDLNKDTIGPDKAKIKIHMILKLPEPPIAVAATPQ